MPMNGWISDDEGDNQAVKTLKMNMISRLENEQVFLSEINDTFKIEHSRLIL